jgi:hypothetical protein
MTKGYSISARIFRSWAGRQLSPNHENVLFDESSGMRSDGTLATAVLTRWALYPLSAQTSSSPGRPLRICLAPAPRHHALLHAGGRGDAVQQQA